MKTHSILKSLLLALSIFLAACAELQPIFLPGQSTSAPAATGVWSELERIYAGNWQVPLNDGKTALEWRLHAIDSATQSINLQSFIWTLDKSGSLIHDRLIQAADRGVDVKILIDDSFLAGADQQILALHEHQNIQYRVYNPYKRRSTNAVSRQVLNLSEFDRLDHRMHNKTMVVDNQVAIIGGRNLADEYFGIDKEYNFRDMELLVGGPIVPKIAMSFDTYWNDHWSFPIDAVGHLGARRTMRTTVSQRAEGISSSFPVLGNDTRDELWRQTVQTSFRGTARLYVDKPPSVSPDAPGDRPVQVADELVQLVNTARKEVVIVSAYLIPTPPVTAVLRDAAERGVTVRILTNSINSNNHVSAYAAYRSHVSELLSFGAQVHELRVQGQGRSRYILPPISQKKLGLHAKYMIIDGQRVFVGSANLDPRSLRINTEIGLVVDSRALSQKLLALTEPDFAKTSAWQLALTPEGQINWIGESEVLLSEPASSGFQKMEEWFFAHLPIEAEL
ncbi:MAG: phospholipase D family protein [Rhizobiaceae bacterium]